MRPHRRPQPYLRPHPRMAGLLDLKLSDIIDQIPKRGGGRGGRGQPDGRVPALGRVIIDADPEVLRRIDRLTNEVIRANRMAGSAAESAVAGAKIAVLASTAVVLALIITRRRL